MRRRLLVLGSFGLLAFVGVLGVVSGGAAATAGGVVWENAIPVPGIAALNGAGSDVASVSCAAAGECAAGGGYVDVSNGAGHAFVLSETNGVWHHAVEVQGLPSVHGSPWADSAYVSSVSCAVAGECAAGGSYTDGITGISQAFVVSEASGVWGDAVEVPGTATLNSGGDARVVSVSCAAAGECAAGGDYEDSSHFIHAFVVNETSGVWGNAIDVPGISTTTLTSVSCAAVGECAAGGYYYVSHVGNRGFVASETNGVWGDAVDLPGVTQVESVSCAAAGECAAGGLYDPSGHAHAVVVSETSGVWGNAIDVPGLDALGASGGPGVNSISCAAAGECGAGGGYVDSSGQPQAFVVSEANGVWGDAVEVSGTAAGSPNSDGSAEVWSVSCAAAGECGAGGFWVDGSYHGHAFVVSETNGVWGDTAAEVPGLATLNTGNVARVWSVSCTADGGCVAGGALGPQGGWVTGTAGYSVSYTGNGATGGSAPSDQSGPYLSGMTVTVLGAGTLTKTGYTFKGWNTRADASGTTYESGDTFSMPASDLTLYAQWSVNSYAVAYAGNGATSGRAPIDGASPHEYGTTVTVVGAGSLTRTGYAFYRWNTAANGSGTSYSPGATFRMPASAVKLYARWAKRLLAGTTTCNGIYAGTGSRVVVPAFATCTLIRGTHVTTSVVVKPRGILYISGVTIDGNLTMSGSATVCASKIGGAVFATGGSFALGGPVCGGNTVIGNILVTNDANNVWIWHNTAKGNLTVKYGSGATDSIASNNVSGNLLVAYSGPPVVVSMNRAYTARCVSNKGQRGSGNVAIGQNTCPH